MCLNSQGSSFRILIDHHDGQVSEPQHADYVVLRVDLFIEGFDAEFYEFENIEAEDFLLKNCSVVLHAFVGRAGHVSDEDKDFVEVFD